MRKSMRLIELTILIGGLMMPACAGSTPLIVSHDDAKAFHSIADAVAALPDTGGDIRVMPGEYREKLIITKNDVHIFGMGATPKDAVIVWGDSALTANGTFNSSTLDVKGNGFHLDNMTVQNDYSKTPTSPPSQAVALSLSGDKDVLTRVRLLGAQDTLLADSKSKTHISRQYFSDCYIEGHVDFIFGDAKAFFQSCELHGLAHNSVMFTAQSKRSPEQDSAYVFKDCRLTADADAKSIYLGRPWRPYAAVIFLDTRMDAPVEPAGWMDWYADRPDDKRLPTAYYAEYHSTGIGANDAKREPYAHLLTKDEAEKWFLSSFYQGDTDWLPKGAVK